jgi:hypothetical protein
MKRRSHLSATLLLALAACGGGSFAPAPTPTPSPANVACVVFGAFPALTLVSPAPGAEGVPQTTNALVLSGTLGTLGVSVKLSDPQGAQWETNVLAPTGADQYTVAIPNWFLAPVTTYTVAVVVQTGESAPCNQLSLNLGSFTTQ